MERLFSRGGAERIGEGANKLAKMEAVFGQEAIR